MFSQKQEPETTALMPLDKAKECFTQRLSPRIKIYEDRLKKPWIQQSWEYCTTSYGENGYERTKNFLQTMEVISSTEKLIDLTNLPEYNKEGKLQLLLRLAVLTICGYTDDHIRFMEDVHNTMKGKHEFVTMAEFDVTKSISYVEAVATVYKKIIDSPDYGQKALKIGSAGAMPKDNNFRL